MSNNKSSTKINDRFWFAVGLPKPVSEFKFHPERRWRFDYAYPEKKIAIEIEGGIFTNGRHVRGKGFLNDLEKYNNAALLGWKLLRYTPSNIDYDQIRKLYNSIN